MKRKPVPAEPSDQDIMEAMEEIPGYIDISPEDFHEVYRISVRHAAARAERISPPPKRRHGQWVGLAEVVWSWLGAFIGIGILAWLNYRVGPGDGGLWLLGSFGASSVLAFGAMKSPLAQPWNLVGGHVISAAIGVGCHFVLPDMPELAAPLAVGTAVGVMHLCRCLHPPGGATALIAVIGGPEIHALGFGYVLYPVAAGAVVLLLTALAFNRLVPTRKYPEYWW